MRVSHILEQMMPTACAGVLRITAFGRALLAFGAAALADGIEYKRQRAECRDIRCGAAGGLGEMA